MEGGDLRFHMTEKFPENTARFYVGQMLLGLESLHAQGILYRDLKPENCLLDGKGHLRLSDFGLSVILGLKEGELKRKASGHVGTQSYMGPDLLSGRPYGVEVDWWAWASILYELLSGSTPSWQSGPVSCDTLGVTADCTSLLNQTLNLNSSERLGCGSNVLACCAAIKSHQFFSQINWEEMEKGELKPPLRIDPRHVKFSTEAEIEEELVNTKPKEITFEAQAKFANFDINAGLSKHGVMAVRVASPPPTLEDAGFSVFGLGPKLDEQKEQLL
jgi:serine/threonine protein kinase